RSDARSDPSSCRSRSTDSLPARSDTGSNIGLVTRPFRAGTGAQNDANSRRLLRKFVLVRDLIHCGIGSYNRCRGAPASTEYACALQGLLVSLGPLDRRKVRREFPPTMPRTVLRTRRHEIASV